MHNLMGAAVGMATGELILEEIDSSSLEYNYRQMLWKYGRDT